MLRNSCPQCGTANESEANFCHMCGQSLDSRPGEATATHAATRIDQDEAPYLIVTRGGAAGSRYLVKPGLTRIGRHPESDVFLDDVTVSRRHSEILRECDTFTVSDVGSLNGTYVDSQRIEVQELTEGSQLQIGKFRLVFVFGGSHGDD